MIIVCGADNTGKTTLVNFLAEHFRLHKLPSFARLTGKMPHEDPKEWVKWQTKYLNNKFSDNFIFDRFYVDEFVYGPIMRGKVCIDRDQRKELDDLIIKVNPLIIFCKTNFLPSFHEREQYPSILQNQKVQDEFENVLYTQLPFGTLEKVRFDYRYDPYYADIVKVVENYLNKTKEEEK